MRQRLRVGSHTFDALDAALGQLLCPPARGVASQGTHRVRGRPSVGARREQAVDDREALCAGGTDDEDGFLRHG